MVKLLNNIGTRLNNNIGLINNILKLGLLLVLGIALVVYMVLMSTGKVGKNTEVKADYKPTPADISTASETINNILTLNSSGCVISSNDTKGYLEVEVNLNLWKKLTVKEEKQLIEELAHSRSMLGKNPVVKIVDGKLNEHASFENNRVTLSKFDF